MVLTSTEAEVKERFFPKLARVLAQVPFADELVASIEPTDLPSLLTP